MTALGPIRPKKKPKPKKIYLDNDEFCWMDAEDVFKVGTELFVCINEDPAEFDLLDSGTYTLESGQQFTVLDGVITTV